MFVRSSRRGQERRPKQAAGKSVARDREPPSQRRLDLIALGCLLLGVYLVFVLYFGWNGGWLGQSVGDGLRYLLGLGAYLVPGVLFAAGIVCAFRPSLPATRPVVAGIAALATGLLLAMAAGTAGIFGGRSAQVQWFDPGWFPDHGGVLGESLYWAAATLLRPFGANLLAVFSLLAGLLLLTGTTIATVLTSSGRAIRRAGASSAEATRRLIQLDHERDVADPGDDAAATGFADDQATNADESPAVAVDDEDATTVIPAEAAPEAAAPTGRDPSPVEIDIWAEPGTEPGLSPNSELLEPFDPFAGEQPDPDQTRALSAEGSATPSFTDDLDQELNDLEREFGGDEELPEVELESDPELDAGVEGSPPDGDTVQMELTPMGERRGATVAGSAIRYRKPPAKVLDRSRKGSGPDPASQKELARKLVETLGHFGVEARIVGVVTGPHVSRFELELAPGTKVKKVSQLSSDLAYALASTDIRILAPIPGKRAVGVEVPNESRKMVRLGDIYSKPPEGASPLFAWLGKGIDGKPVSADLAAMPHVLVAGTTGSGKSGCVNAVLSSILMHASPNEVRFVLVDPKQVELNHYEAIPHLLTPVVTQPKLAANVLANLLAEMETRYGLMKQARARNIADYNEIMTREQGDTLPHILCVIDELADLMMVAPADVESAIIRLAQKSRATGIHLLLATQRPSTDIITGTIKVNIPSRIAFSVSSQTDSRVILDQGGAEALLGKGDMLYRGPGTSKLARIQGAFVDEEEIARITDFWSAQGEPVFEQGMLDEREAPQTEAPEGDFDPDQDDLLDEAIQLVVDTETASVSMIQRRLRVGYTRAGRLIDMLERRGVISGYEGSKPRQVLVTAADLPRILGGGQPEVGEGADPPATAENRKEGLEPIGSGGAGDTVT